MKNNFLTSLLLGLFFLSTLANGGLIWRYNTSLHQLERQSQDQELQQRLAQINNARSIMQAILKDTLEYSQTNRSPEMMRILQGLNAKNKPAAK